VIWENVMDEPQVPLGTVPPEVVERLSQLGAPPRAASLKLYRALASHPDVLLGWIEFAWRLRNDAVTSRRLRELMIVRSAMLDQCDYELRGHEEFALEHGVTQDELLALPNWENSTLFSLEERAALALSEAMHLGTVPSEVLDRLGRLFSPAAQVELIVTCAFYNMVPRVIDALRLTPEERYFKA
jgi:4-carboxymuconolactone decarboxylase